ncbi:MAG: ABC transporter transmembrane domain-containing protein [Alphaproteobacteria bacterium]
MSAGTFTGLRSKRLSEFSTLPSNMLDLVLASLFLNVLSLAMPLSLLQVYDRIVPNNSDGTLVLLVVGIAAALLLEGILRMARSTVTGWVGARFEHIAGCSALERLLASDIKDYARDGAGVHLERINALGTVKEFYAGQAVLAIFDLPFVLVYLALVGFLGGSLVIVPIFLLAAFAVSAVLLGRRLRGSLKERMVADERRFGFIIEVLGGIHTVKSMAMEAQMLRRYERLQETCASNNYSVALHNASALGLGAFFAQVTVIAVVAFGAMIVIDQRLTVGGLAACTMLAGRAMQPLMRAIGIWTRLQTIRLASERLRQIFAMRPEAPPGLPPLPDIQGAVEVENVSLRYSDKGPDVLRNITLHLEPGECVGIAGGNSSGKSSLLGVLVGVLAPTEGRVLVDGNDIRSFDRSTFKHSVAYMPQNGELFQGTLLDNITMFDPSLHDEAVRAARSLGLDDVVASMPFGYETRIGDSAMDTLPRGIKQRIAIARALIYHPRIVLFDEANTAIDRAGDDYLRVALERLKGVSTMVLVTHRPSLLRLADKVYDLQDGHLTERVRAPALAAGPRMVTP